jgi:hypothetical protein
VRTAGRRQEFVALEVKYGTRFRQHQAARHWLERRIREIPGLLEELSIPAALRLDEDLDAIAALLRLGDADVFSPVDICPDNNLTMSDGIRFIDFESAGFHSALARHRHYRSIGPSERLDPVRGA